MNGKVDRDRSKCREPEQIHKSADVFTVFNHWIMATRGGSGVCTNSLR